MKNTIYLLKTELRDYALFKVGFTKDISKRLYAYTTHNPSVELVSMVETYSKTGRTLEKAIHKEIEKRGFQFYSAKVDGKKTEWFMVSYKDAFFAELVTKGLNAFTQGKNRKVKLRV